MATDALTSTCLLELSVQDSWREVTTLMLLAKQLVALLLIRFAGNASTTVMYVEQSVSLRLRLIAPRISKKRFVTKLSSVNRLEGQAKMNTVAISPKEEDSLKMCDSRTSWRLRV
eukprot:4305693-Amphidinium_carterae.2